MILIPFKFQEFKSFEFDKTSLEEAAAYLFSFRDELNMINN